MKQKCIALAFTIHAVVGSFCAMPIAHAMPLQEHAVIEETIRMMSHDDCPDCSRQIDTPHQQIPCSTGHCISMYQPDASLLSNAAIENQASTTLHVMLWELSSTTQNHALREYKEKIPPPETGIRTIVLRQ